MKKNELLKSGTEESASDIEDFMGNYMKHLQM